MLNSTIYKHPQFRAAVAVERRGEMILLDFLARGRSQKKSGGRVTGYATRNPDRRALVDHVIDCLGRAPLEGSVAIGSAGGKGAPYLPLGVGAVDPTVRKSYSSSGNYRWRLWLQLPTGEAGQPELELENLTSALGLETDAAHRPVKTTWPAILLAALIAVVGTFAASSPASAAARPTQTGLSIGSLFAGVGGIEAGLEWAGHGPTLWQVEKHEKRRQILAKNWPAARRFELIENVGSRQLERPDILTAGFPCGDTSVAGKGARP